jgi:hypothetical protein
MVEITNGQVKGSVMSDIIDATHDVEIARAAATMEHAPWFFTDEKHPTRLERAAKALREGRITLLSEQEARVQGSEKVYSVRGFHCTCPASTKGKSFYCVHAVAVKLAREVQTRLGQHTQASLPLSPVTAEERLAQTPLIHGHCIAPALPDGPQDTDGTCAHPTANGVLCAIHLELAQAQEETEASAEEEIPVMLTPDPTVADATPDVRIPRQFISTIKGKQFVQFAGLLAMAHATGLQSLSEEFISVTPELALARAVVTFTDGRTFSACADATPENVNAMVRNSFARISLTRAKARALRDALNVACVSVEELDV